MSAVFSLRAADAVGIEVASTALVVDPMAGLLGTIAAHLAGESYRVLTARDFREAITHLSAAMPDVVTVDLGLPRGSGYAVCEYMRAMPAFARVPIVLTAVCEIDPDQVWAKGVGRCAFLRKPYSMVQLTRVLEEAVREVRSAGPAHGAPRLS
jgi:DNA-binding response OmpR family regulator